MLTLTEVIDHHEYDKVAIEIDVPQSQGVPVMSVRVGDQSISLTSDELARLQSIMSSFERSLEAFNAKS